MESQPLVIFKFLTKTRHGGATIATSRHDASIRLLAYLARQTDNVLSYRKTSVVCCPGVFRNPQKKHTKKNPSPKKNPGSATHTHPAYSGRCFHGMPVITLKFFRNPYTCFSIAES